MKIIPSEVSFRIETASSKNVTIDRLRESVGPRRRLFFGSDKEFDGDVYHDSFEIKESVGYSYALLPVFRGKVESKKDTTVIHVKVSNMLTSIAVGWGWACATGLLIAGIKGIRSTSVTESLPLIGMAFLCAGMLLLFSRFYSSKVDDGKAWLKRLLS